MSSHLDSRGLNAWWAIRAATHDNVIKWKHYWPLVRGIHQSPVNNSQWRGALMFSLVCA